MREALEEPEHYQAAPPRGIRRTIPAPQLEIGDVGEKQKPTPSVPASAGMMRSKAIQLPASADLMRSMLSSTSPRNVQKHGSSVPAHQNGGHQVQAHGGHGVLSLLTNSASTQMQQTGGQQAARRHSSPPKASVEVKGVPGTPRGAFVLGVGPLKYQSPSEEHGGAQKYQASFDESCNGMVDIRRKEDQFMDALQRSKATSGQAEVDSACNVHIKGSREQGNISRGSCARSAARGGVYESGSWEKPKQGESLHVSDMSKVPNLTDESDAVMQFTAGFSRTSRRCSISIVRV